MQKWTRVMYQPNIALGENGGKVTACKAHIALSKEAAKEGMVLLKMTGICFRLQRGAGSPCLERRASTMCAAEAEAGR